MAAADQRRKPTWIADFTVNFVPVVLRLAKKSHCPTTDTLEYLHTRGWTMPIPCSVTMAKPYAYRQLAPKAAELRNAGMSKERIASELGVTSDTVMRALYFAETGGTPGGKRNHRKCRESAIRRKKEMQYKGIAAEVVRRRDELKCPEFLYRVL